MPRVAIQGQIASFHHHAAKGFFGDKVQIVPCETFAETFTLLQEAKADYAVVAIENSLHGPINDVYDLLLGYRPWIYGERYVHIEQCLIGLPGASISALQEVHSHPVALSQCSTFLDTTLAHAARFEHHDTAGSVADIAIWDDPAKAAIASAQAAAYYGMQVLQRGIETHRHNYTRFVLLTREQVGYEQADKTSIIIETPHHTGALYDALGCFAQADINLSLLVSRPIIGQPNNYMFYADFERGLGAGESADALHRLAAMGCKVTLLGSYRASRLIDAL